DIAFTDIVAHGAVRFATNAPDTAINDGCINDGGDAKSSECCCTPYCRRASVRDGRPATIDETTAVRNNARRIGKSDTIKFDLAGTGLARPCFDFAIEFAHLS
ncbi:MAG: hypothetical protein FWC50_14455, partial [Planctomycetaceae bacterium]|nr:hypothetical protein [Planctomycetaceae bacterium]